MGIINTLLQKRPPNSASPYSAPPTLQEQLMATGVDSGDALNLASTLTYQMDPSLGQRVAAYLRQHYPQKRPSHHLGGGR